MKYPKDFINKIIQGDCLEVMKKMPDNCVDLVLTDPPYELTNGGSGKSFLTPTIQKIAKGLEAIENGFDEENWFKEIKRICKKVHCFIFCSNKQITKIMKLGEDNGYITTLLIWHKTNSTPFANNVWRGDIEYCVHIRESGATFQGNAQLKRKVWSGKMNIEKYHPTVKPMSLIEKYLLIGSNENDIILDPFLGSGTTAVACQQFKRNFIGIEISEKYCKIAKQRLRQQVLL